MNDNGLPAVHVTGAPGYADFDGELIRDLATPDGRLLSAVGFEHEGKQEYALVPAACVEIVTVDDATTPAAPEGMSAGEFVNIVTSGPNWNK